MQEAGPHWKITPKSTWFSYEMKKSVLLRNNLTRPLLLIRPNYKLALQGMELYEKYGDRFQDLSKVQSPALIIVLIIT